MSRIFVGFPTTRRSALLKYSRHVPQERIWLPWDSNCRIRSSTGEASVVRKIPEFMHMIRAGGIAKDLLECSDAPLSRVAERVGFNSIESFRRHFRLIVGTSPSAYRAQFSRNAT